MAPNHEPHTGTPLSPEVHHEDQFLRPIGLIIRSKLCYAMLRYLDMQGSQGNIIGPLRNI